MKDQTRTLADAILANVEVNASNITWTQAGYDAILPETVTAEQATILHGHDKALIPAVTVAFGEKAIEVLAANPSFPQVEGTAHIGATKITTITERVGMRTTGVPKEGQQVEKVPTPGLTSVKVTTNAGSELKKARDHVAALGADKL